MHACIIIIIITPFVWLHLRFSREDRTHRFRRMNKVNKQCLCVFLLDLVCSDVGSFHSSRWVSVAECLCCGWLFLRHSHVLLFACLLVCLFVCLFVCSFVVSVQSCFFFFFSFFFFFFFFPFFLFVSLSSTAFLPSFLPSFLRPQPGSLPVSLTICLFFSFYIFFVSFSYFSFLPLFLLFLALLPFPSCLVVSISLQCTLQQPSFAPILFSLPAFFDEADAPIVQALQIALSLHFGLHPSLPQSPLSDYIKGAKIAKVSLCVVVLMMMRWGRGRRGRCRLITKMARLLFHFILAFILLSHNHPYRIVSKEPKLPKWVFDLVVDLVIVAMMRMRMKMRMRMMRMYWDCCSWFILFLSSSLVSDPCLLSSVLFRFSSFLCMPSHHSNANQLWLSFSFVYFISSFFFCLFCAAASSSSLFFFSLRSSSSSLLFVSDCSELHSDVDQFSREGQSDGDGSFRHHSHQSWTQHCSLDVFPSCFWSCCWLEFFCSSLHHQPQSTFNNNSSFSCSFRTSCYRSHSNQKIVTILFSLSFFFFSAFCCQCCYFFFVVFGFLVWSCSCRWVQLSLRSSRHSKSETFLLILHTLCISFLPLIVILSMARGGPHDSILPGCWWHSSSGRDENSGQSFDRRNDLGPWRGWQCLRSTFCREWLYWWRSCSSCNKRTCHCLRKSSLALMLHDGEMMRIFGRTIIHAHCGGQ